MTDLNVNCRNTSAGPVLEFAGDLNSTNAPDALATIRSVPLQPGQQLVVDLTGLRFCDSSGIATLIAARNLAVTAGAGIALAAVPPHLGRALTVVGLADLFTSYPTAQDAVDAWPR